MEYQLDTIKCKHCRQEITMFQRYSSGTKFYGHKGGFTSCQDMTHQGKIAEPATETDQVRWILELYE